jgi:cbb3-type cytochrome oxidase subunit 3
VNVGQIGLLAFGLALVALFAGVVVYYYGRKRKTHVEQAKYKMLDDD